MIVSSWEYPKGGERHLTFALDIEEVLQQELLVVLFSGHSCV
jgi:hypothetical protein